MPWPEIELATVTYQDDSLTNWATQLGPLKKEVTMLTNWAEKSKNLK